MSASNTPARVNVFRRKKALWWIIAVLILAIGSGAALYSCDGERDVSSQLSGTDSGSAVSQSKPAEKARVIKVKLHPVDWSDWIRLPPNTNYVLDVPGWHEYWFWDGTKKYVPDNTVQWFGDVPSCTFRLRGKEGEATISF